MSYDSYEADFGDGFYPQLNSDMSSHINIVFEYKDSDATWYQKGGR